MTIDQFNNKIKEEIQQEREAKVPYKVYIQKLYKFYRDLVKTSVDSNFVSNYLPSSTNIDDLKKEILRNTNALLRAYNAYSEGKLSTAITIMGNKFLQANENEPSISHTLYSVWYRARKLTNNNRNFQPHEMFHIPFEKRTEVVNYRFSIAGYPCLYLGKTILGCWVEMGNPALDDMAVSRIEVERNKTIKVLDLRIPTEENVKPLFGGLTDEDRRIQNYELLIKWPLIISCSIKTITPDASFKHEYVHPQLLMLALMENTDYYGIAYTSTHMDKNLSSNEDDYCNLAIPVKKVKDKGLCPILSQSFKITRGVPLMEMDIKNVFKGSSSTKFNQAEDWMKSITTETISSKPMRKQIQNILK